MDFTPLTHSNLDVFERLNNGSRSACFDVTITLDQEFEASETFSLQLGLDAFGNEGVRNIVTIEPSVVYVTIQDTTEGFGFDRLQYDVREDAQFANLTIRLSGMISTNIVVHVSTANGSAFCKFGQILLHLQAMSCM